MSRQPPSTEITLRERQMLLSAKQVAPYVGVKTPQSVWNYVKQGIIPQPVYIKPHMPRWKLGELLDAVDAQLKSPDEVPRGIKGDPKPAKKAPKNAIQRMRERLSL